MSPLLKQRSSSVVLVDCARAKPGSARRRRLASDAETKRCSSYSWRVLLATTAFNAVGVSLCFLVWVGILVWVRRS